VAFLLLGIGLAVATSALSGEILHKSLFQVAFLLLGTGLVVATSALSGEILHKKWTTRDQSTYF
jgi:hypothetical protein